MSLDLSFAQWSGMGAEADIFDDCFRENQQLSDSSRSQSTPSSPIADTEYNWIKRINLHINLKKTSLRHQKQMLF
jgi:hypothetical protein